MSPTYRTSVSEARSYQVVEAVWTIRSLSNASATRCMEIQCGLYACVRSWVATVATHRIYHLPTGSADELRARHPQFVGKLVNRLNI